MAKEKVSFNDFLEGVVSEDRVFVGEPNSRLIEQGCDLVAKEAKSGYVAIYQFDKKTATNWVLHKSGILARIYGDNVDKYEDITVSLPADMQKK